MRFDSDATPGAVHQLREMWEHKSTDQRPLSRAWDAAIADWIEKFEFGNVADAMQQASVAGYSEEGERLPPNIRDVPKYAAVLQAEEREPGMRACYLVRGRMRKKFYCNEDDGVVLALLRKAMRAGISGSEMHQAVDDNTTLEDCFASLGIDRPEFRTAMGRSVDDPSSSDQIFIRESDPEWRSWCAHWRKIRGINPPMNKDFGWFFPSRLPPTEPQSKRASRSRTG